MSKKEQGKMRVVLGELLRNKAKYKEPIHARKVLARCDCCFADSGGLKQEE